MSCETNRELLEMYALGALDAEDRIPVDEHLRENCIRCTAELRKARALNTAVLGSLPLATPSPLLRTRILNSIRPVRARRSPVAWIRIAAGLAVATIWLGLEAQHRSNELAVAQIRMRELQQRSDELGRSLTFLRDPETRPAVSRP